ncbi:MAG TPA: DUF378 domain-containing protein [Candidatus Krumholzibacteria bacterium]|nr:DUF378 domain-containing protein [Candidatus Krumholzibacteria bacterium]
MKSLDIVSAILVVVGALNWGLVGLFQFDLVATLFGGQSAVTSRIVYALVGIAGIFLATRLKSGLGVRTATQRA